MLQQFADPQRLLFGRISRLTSTEFKKISRHAISVTGDFSYLLIK